MGEADTWIDALEMLEHPEGGYFRETYRSAERLEAEQLPERFDGPRPLATAIYFLLRAGEFSALHRLNQDEIWHFYAGDGLILHQIDPEGGHVVRELGPETAAGPRFQAVMPAGCWFGATLPAGARYALVGCTVSPGFEFADLELGDRASLLAAYPQHRELIERLTRGA